MLSAVIKAELPSKQTHTQQQVKDQSTHVPSIHMVSALVCVRTPFILCVYVKPHVRLSFEKNVTTWYRLGTEDVTTSS